MTSAGGQTSNAEAAFTYVNQYGTVVSYADEIGEKRSVIKRYMLLRYKNWIISDVDFVNHITAVLPAWATYHFKNNDGLGPKYVFVDFLTASVHLDGASTMNWKSIIRPTKSEAILEVFVVRGGVYGETLLEVFREFVSRAAESTKEGGIKTGHRIEPYDDIQSYRSTCTGREQWERLQMVSIDHSASLFF